jgi:hypothetical protein
MQSRIFKRLRFWQSEWRSVNTRDKNSKPSGRGKATCIVCGDPSCDHDHPEVRAYADGLEAMQAVLARIAERETIEEREAA